MIMAEEFDAEPFEGYLRDLEYAGDEPLAEPERGDLLSLIHI